MNSQLVVATMGLIAMAGCCDTNRRAVRLHEEAGYGRVAHLGVVIEKTLVVPEATVQPVVVRTDTEAILVRVSYCPADRPGETRSYCALIYPNSIAQLESDATFRVTKGRIFVSSECPEKRMALIASTHPIDVEDWVWVREGDRVEAGAEGSALLVYAETPATPARIVYVRADNLALLYVNKAVEGRWPHYDRSKYQEVSTIFGRSEKALGAEPASSQINSDLELAKTAGFDINWPP